MKKNFKVCFISMFILLIIGYITFESDSNQNNILQNSVVNIKYDSNKYDFTLLSDDNQKIGYRYLQEGAIVSGIDQDKKCGDAVYINSCDNSGYCYYMSVDGTVKVLRSKLSTTLEGAKGTCKQQSNVGNRYVVSEKKDFYSCGDKVYITTCDSKNCQYMSVNGIKRNGTIERSKLRFSSSEAKTECDSIKEIGYRYVAKSSDKFECSDKLYITTCTNTTCKYSSVNGRNGNGSIDRTILRETKSAAESECSVKGNRYLAIDNEIFNCGDELYITGCTEKMCDFTRINGIKKNGTINRTYLHDEKTSATKSCIKIKDNESDFGERYAATKGYNYSCGDKLYITTCDEDYCNYTKVNGSKNTGRIDRTSLRETEANAKKDCGDVSFYGYRYASTSGHNFQCGDKLYIVECDENICTYNTVNGTKADGAIERGRLTVTKSSAISGCKASNFGDRYVSVDGSNYSCGDKLYITTCDTKNCNYTYVNGVSTNGTVLRDALKVDEVSAKNECENNSEYGERYVSVNGDDYSCGDKLYVASCSMTTCNYTKIITEDGNEIWSEGNINRDLLKTEKSSADAICEKTEVKEDDKECSNTEYEDMTGSSSYTMCYKKDSTLEKIKEDLEKLYLCDTQNKYVFDKTYVSPVGEETCNEHGLCSKTFNVNCTKSKEGKPTISVTSGIAQSNGKGIIGVKVNSYDGKVDSYYYSEEYVTPTTTSNGWHELNSDTFTIESSPGIKYIWVKDENGNISAAMNGAVLDSKTVSTTIKMLELKDANGNSLTADKVAHSTDIISKKNYMLLSNSLKNESKIAASFNMFDMEYKLNVSSPTVSVYATLTSNDSKYVSGYEPRTVNLKYGVNTILIKIQNKEGAIRTYTILVTRTDDRTSDNTINELSLSVGKIDFNSNVTDYKVEIPNNTKNIDIKANLSNEKASFIEGYEPGTVRIVEDTTVKLLKVKSETGSTRTYVITFLKENTDVITDNSLKLIDLVIPGIYVPFEENIANYSVSTEYETDKIDLNIALKDKSSSYIIKSKNKNSSKYITTSNIGIPLDVGENFIEIEVSNAINQKSYYRITVIRKEVGLGISSDTTLKDLKVMGYDIKFNPSEKDYVVRIKREKSLVITAVPNSNRAEVFIRGNEELTGFSTVRIKVVAENGEYETYSVDIKKDAFNKVIEIAALFVAVGVIVSLSTVLVLKRKNRSMKEYIEE